MTGHACATRHAGTRTTGATILRWLRLSFLVAIASAACATSSWACTCASNPERIFANASIVFRGTAISTERVIPSDCKDQFLPECRPHDVGLFTVEQTLKGFPKGMVRIHSYDFLMCGPSYPVGETRWVAATGDEERGYSYHSCMWFSAPKEPGPLADMIDQYQGRQRSLSDAVERRPADPDALMELAAFYAETGSRLEALAILDRLLAVEPLHRDGLLLKADQLAIGPDQSAVLESLAPYLAAHPDDQDALRRQVLALVRSKRLGEAPSEWRDFTGLHGWDFDFSGRDLNNASFRGNHMFRPSFAEAELRNADFADAWIEGDFAGADLTGAVMKSARLHGSSFTGALLSGANLTGAGLERANFGGAVLDRADLAGADLDVANLDGASLKGAKLSGATLRGARYDDATVWPAGFDPAAAGAVKQQ